MPILSSIFGGSNSSDGNIISSLSNDFVSDLTSSLSVDASSSNFNQSVGSDGSSNTSASEQSFGTDLDIGNLLGTMTDGIFGASQSDDSASGGLF